MVERLSVAVAAAREAGRYQREQFGTVTDDGYEYKSPGDPVSEIDHESERVIVERLRDAFPEHGLLSEERGVVAEGRGRWIVDPLDGTSNYLRGHPDFTVSIAYERDEALDTGVVYRPTSDELFAASRNGGVHDDSVALNTAGTSERESALVALPYSSSAPDRDDLWATHRALGSTVEGIRSSGSCALDLAYLAAGTIDAVCGFDQSRWDRAAGLALATLAGGRVTDHDGRDRSGENFVASNGPLHEEVVDRVQSERRGTDR